MDAHIIITRPAKYIALLKTNWYSHMTFQIFDMFILDAKNVIELDINVKCLILVKSWASWLVKRLLLLSHCFVFKKLEYYISICRYWARGRAVLVGVRARSVGVVTLAHLAWAGPASCHRQPLPDTSPSDSGNHLNLRGCVLMFHHQHLNNLSFQRSWHKLASCERHNVSVEIIELVSE